MADSIREQLIVAIVARAGGISTANGASFDPAILRGSGEITEQDRPAINIKDREEETEEYGGAFLHKMRVIFEAAKDLEEGENYSEEANKLIADIKRGMFGADPTFGGIGDGLTIDLSESDDPSNGSTVARVSVEFIATYRDKRGDPSAHN